VFLIEHDGSEHQLTTGPGIKAPVAISPDAKAFVYRVETGGAQPAPSDGTFLVAIAGGAPRRIPEDQSLFGHTASFSPDGKRLVLDLQPEGENRTALFVMNADGTNPTRISPQGTDDQYPAWSPHGETIAFQRTTAGGGFMLRTIESDGTKDVELTAGPADEWPAWSPNAALIAFQGHAGIMEIALDGSAPRLLVNAADGGAPLGWSPGETLAFACQAGEWVCTADPRGVAIDLVRGNFPVWLPN
jgi:TolB protein